MHTIKPPVPNLSASAWVNNPSGVLSINSDVLKIGNKSLIVPSVIENDLDCVVTIRIVL